MSPYQYSLKVLNFHLSIESTVYSVPECHNKHNLKKKATLYLQYLTMKHSLLSKDGYLCLLLEKNVRQKKYTGDVFLSGLDIHFKNRCN